MKIWTITEMGPVERVLAEELTDDEAWNFLEDYTKKRRLGDVPKSLENLIESVINSALRQAVSEQLTLKEKFKEATFCLDQFFEKCKQTHMVTEEEHAIICELASKAEQICYDIVICINEGDIRSI